MLNVYVGNVETDDKGGAVVTLPDYFDALNQDFTYQLTSIGQFAQATISEEIHENRFSIKTDKPNIKVSWQVTGYAKTPTPVRTESCRKRTNPRRSEGCTCTRRRTISRAAVTSTTSANAHMRSPGVVERPGERAVEGSAIVVR